LALSAAATAFAPGVALADDVYLVHGEVFKGVVAEETDTQVRIRMAGGEVRLARTQVVKVVASRSPYQLYLLQRAALEADSAAPARAWLDLARLAFDQGLRGPAREAALAAARLDPDLEGLGAMLRRLDYVRDPESGEWLSRAQDLARRGFVLFEGEWVSAEEGMLRLRAQEEARFAARRRFEEAAARQARAAGPPAPAAEVNLFVTPIVYSLPLPWFIVRTVPGGPSSAPAPRPPGGAPVMDLLERQPGSLIPGILSLDRPASPTGR
jgi:hypothetical protein